MPTGPLQGVLRSLRRRAFLQQEPELGDGQLLECFIARRDEGAFAALLHRHGPMVLGVCRRVLGNLPDAEDAFQATFLVLARKAGSLRSRELVGNWLYGVAYRTAMKAKAMNARRRRHEKRAGERVRPHVSGGEDWEELAALLDQELSRLPDRYRSAVVLCDLEGKTRKEAARLLKVPEGTVSSRLAAARKMLARRLGHSSLALPAGALAALLAPGVVSAAVPRELAAATVEAAGLVVGGGSVSAGYVSAKVLALMEGVLKIMLLNRLRTTAAVLLVLGLFTGGAALLSHRSLGAEPQPIREASGGRAPARLKGSPSGYTYVIDRFDPVQETLKVHLRNSREKLGRTVYCVWDVAEDVAVIKASREVRLRLLRPGTVVQLWLDRGGVDPKTGRTKSGAFGVVTRIVILTEGPGPKGKDDKKWVADKEFLAAHSHFLSWNGDFFQLNHAYAKDGKILARITNCASCHGGGGLDDWLGARNPHARPVDDRTRRLMKEVAVRTAVEDIQDALRLQRKLGNDRETELQTLEEIEKAVRAMKERLRREGGR